MALKTFFTPKYKILIHGIVLFLSGMNIQGSNNHCKMFNSEGSICTDVFETIIFVMTIYFLALFLFPTLFRNWKKYIFTAIIFLSLYSFTLVWIEAVSSSGLNNLKDIFSSIPLDYLDIKFMFRSLMSIIPIGVLGLLYFLFVTDWEKLKILFFRKNIEKTVNIIAVALIIFYTSVMPQGDSTDEVLYIIFFIFFSYLNTFFITPILIVDKRIQKFLFTSFFWFLGIYVMFFLITYFTSDSYGKNFATNTLLSWSYTSRIIIALFFPIFFLSFIYGYIRVKIKNQDKKLEAKESELQLLKSQVNPHFLFNSLNTLYATALEEQAPKTAESTAKLANLLRYMQEDINKDFIPLENEIKYVQDYITIQKLRCSVEPKIETKFENIKNQVISPGLLIPFVENAFKYGIDPSKPSELKVSVVCDENTIYFKCVNSYNDNFETYYKEQGFGIGIKNAKQRLELVYPKKHHLEVKKENNIFSVKLSIITN